MKYESIDRNESGISLVELLVAAAIVGFVVMAAASAVNLARINMASVSDKVKSEQELNNAAYALRHYISMALNLTASATPGPLNTSNFTSNVGQVGIYNLNSWTATTGPGVVDVIAFFVRENFASGTVGLNPAPLGSSRFPITGVFFQQPTVDKYGVLYIDTSTSVLQPQDSDVKVSHIVDFQISEIFSQVFPATGGMGVIDADLQGKKMVTGITMKIVTRNYFSVSEKAPVLTWCPPQFMPSGTSPTAQCEPNIPYKDVEKSFTFTIRNNVMGRSFTQRGLAPDTTGAADGLVAPIYRRPLDSIYFLSPSIPIGQVSR